MPLRRGKNKPPLEVVVANYTNIWEQKEIAKIQFWMKNIWTLCEHPDRDEVPKASFYQYLWLLKMIRFRSAALSKSGRNVEFTAFFFFIAKEKGGKQVYKILIVDDEAIERRCISFILENS